MVRGGESRGLLESLLPRFSRRDTKHFELRMIRPHKTEPESTFDDVIGRVVRRATKKSANGFVFVFGEMVALLCTVTMRTGR